MEFDCLAFKYPTHAVVIPFLSEFAILYSYNEVCFATSIGTLVRLGIQILMPTMVHNTTTKHCYTKLFYNNTAKIVYLNDYKVMYFQLLNSISNEIHTWVFIL